MTERSARIAAKRTFHRQDERGRESAAVKETLGGKRTFSDNQRDLRDKRDESDAIRGTLRAYTGIGDKRDRQSWREAFTLPVPFVSSASLTRSSLQIASLQSLLSLRSLAFSQSLSCPLSLLRKARAMRNFVGRK